VRTSCGGRFHRAHCSRARGEPRRHPRSPMPHTPPSNFPSSTPPPPPRDEALTVSVRRCTLHLLAAREVSGHLGGTPQGRAARKSKRTAELLVRSYFQCLYLYLSTRFLFFSFSFVLQSWL
jgi:hypothetical protein